MTELLVKAGLAGLGPAIFPLTAGRCANSATDQNKVR